MNAETIDKNWCVIEDGFDIGANQHWESVFALGTGYVTTRATIDEGFENDDQSVEYDRIPGNVSLETLPTRKSRWGTYMPVVQGRHPLWREGIVNLPHYIGLIVTVDGERLDLEKSKIANYRRWLDLKTATLFRTLNWETKAGKRVHLLFRRYMNPDERYVCVQECSVEMVSGSAEIEIESVVDNNVRTNGFDMFSQYAVGKCDDGVMYSDITTNMGGRIITASRMEVDQARGYTSTQQKRQVSMRCAFHAEESSAAFVRKVSVTASDFYFEKDHLLDEARSILKRNIDKNHNALYQEHVDCWAKLWGDSDIEIEAKDRNGYNSQLAIRMSIYHLLRAKAKDEYRGLICPKGLTSEVYMGSVFWDMEIFIEPFYIYTYPDMAKTVHMFRYHNLRAARELTKKAGYSGVRYPWMSAANGTETCPMWEYADHQVHITSDVVIGIWHYYKNSLDDEFLFDYGAEIIFETSRYWVERAEKIPGRTGYHIYGVMGPDEYKPLSNNNAYTNHSVKFNLKLAGIVFSLMLERAPEKLLALKRKLNLSDDELKKFSEVEKGLSVARDNARNIIWQCDNFDTAFAEPDINAIWKDRSELFGAYYSQEKRYRSKTLKQADVVALLAIFSEDFTKDEKTSSFNYYWPLTIHDSSNSMCHHHIVLAQLGRTEEAYQAWLRSIDIDFGTAPRASNGIHCANVGGMWQEIVFGFCGMVSGLNTDVLSFRPSLPSEIHKISFKIQWKRQWVHVTVMNHNMTIMNLSPEPLTFIVNQMEYKAEPKSCCEVALEG